MRVWVFVLGVCVGCSSSTTERLGLSELEPVEEVELERYLGKWYEIASYPQRFQQGCSKTTATYTLRSDGEIDVLNECMKDGELDSATGRARVPDPKASSKLEVVIDLTVEGQHIPPRFRAHGLMARRRQIENRQATMAHGKSSLRIGPGSGIIGASMFKSSRHVAGDCLHAARAPLPIAAQKSDPPPMCTASERPCTTS